MWNVIQEINFKNFGVSGWFRGEPITKAGKRRQVAKILTLVMTPILVLLGVSLYFVSDNVNAKSEFDRVSTIIRGFPKSLQI